MKLKSEISTSFQELEREVAKDSPWQEVINIISKRVKEVQKTCRIEEVNQEKVQSLKILRLMINVIRKQIEENKTSNMGWIVSYVINALS